MEKYNNKKYEGKVDADSIGIARANIDGITSFVSDIDSNKLASEIAIANNNKTLDELKLIANSYVERIVVPCRNKIHVIREELLVDETYFQKRVQTLEKKLDDTTEFIHSDKNKVSAEEGWTQQNKIIILLLIISVVFASIIEIYMSFDMLTNSVPIFQEHPVGAVILGIVPLLLAVTTKWVLQEKNGKYRSYNIKGKIFSGILLIIFLGLQFVIYRMQIVESIEEIFSSTNEKQSRLDDIANILDTSLFSFKSMNFDAMYYSIASLIVFLFVFVATGKIQKILELTKPPAPALENPNWISIQNKYKYSMDMVGMAKGGLMGIDKFEDTVKALVNTVCSYVEYKVTETNKKQEAQKKYLDELLNNKIKLDAEINSVKVDHQKLLHETIEKSPLNHLENKRNTIIKEKQDELAKIDSALQAARENHQDLIHQKIEKSALPNLEKQRDDLLNKINTITNQLDETKYV